MASRRPSGEIAAVETAGTPISKRTGRASARRGESVHRAASAPTSAAARIPAAHGQTGRGAGAAGRLGRRSGAAAARGEVLERDPRVADVAQPVLRVAVEAAAQDAAHGGRRAAEAARDQSMSARSTAASVSETVSPSKAFCPASISYSTAPKAQMSARLSTALPRACSGDM